MADYSIPPEKAKRSLSGAATYKSRFKKDWAKLYPVSEVQNLPGEFCCNVFTVLCPVLTKKVKQM